MEQEDPVRHPHRRQHHQARHARPGPTRQPRWTATQLPRQARLVATTAVAVAVAGIVVVGARAGDTVHRQAPRDHHVAAQAHTDAYRTQPARADRARPPAHIARPHKLVTPDAVVRLDHSAGAVAIRHFRALDGIHATAVLSRGRVVLNGHEVVLVGANLAAVRRFTPQFTARSQPLWESLAGGELTLSYSSVHAFRRMLGATFAAHGRHGNTAPLRLGAFASLGLGREQGLVDATTAATLGLHSAREIVVAAHHVDMATLRADARRIFGRHTQVISQRPETINVAVMSDYARATIPTTYLHLYQAAATTCAGLPWTVLAAIGGVETGHGANTNVSSKGAVGPMQFLPSTFAAYAVDGNGDGIADITNPDDAVYTAARYLCLWGAGRGGQALYDAVFAYNHADWYVRRVFALANAYA
jgi:hypothetical protein